LSNHHAIAAVTATLRALLNRGLNVNTTTVRPPDRIDSTNGSAHLNLFLYQTSQSAALRNMNWPQKVKPGETAPPPLTLNLYYLITAYGPDEADEDLASHGLLGQAMSVLHDHPLLGAEEIQAATSKLDSDLHNQVERIRITPQPMSLEEMSKLWTIFQTNFRISAAYEVSVVLIDSKRPAKTPMPVLSRGKDDEGATGLMPLPVLGSIKIPEGQLSAKLGDKLTITGFNLSGSNLKVLIQPPYQTSETELVIVGQSTDTEIVAELPTDATKFPAGYYKLLVTLRKDGELFDRSTNTLFFALAPKITDPPLPAEVTIENAGINKGNAIIKVKSEPQVLPEQPVSLLLNDLEVNAQPHPDPTKPLEFIIKKAVVGTYLVRLRVDGVDSLLIDTTKTPPVFDQKQTVKIK
jgi:Pvc16 N-terminal domain